MPSDTDEIKGLNNRSWLVYGLVLLIAMIASLVIGRRYLNIGLSMVVTGVVGGIWLIALRSWLWSVRTEAVRKIAKARKTARRYQNTARYFESILQDSSDIIFTVDDEGLMLKFNKGSQLHFGYSQEEIVGKPFKVLFVNEADKRKILDTVLRAGKSVNEEIPMKTREGEIIYCNLSMSEMKDEAGSIIGMVVTAKDITQRKKLEIELLKKNELLERLARTDSLTALFNIRHFYDEVKRELSRIKRNPERPLSLILLDIDHFKEYNDTEGHQMGDKVLKSLAQVIKVCIRKDIDSAYRYGGDEFIILLPDTGKDQARHAAERIQKQFGAFRFGRTSLSIGIAEAEVGESEKSLVKRSDEAMYRSKRGGRSRITV
ncbi:MAG: diguanylate cyclase [Chitinivibrionales bacterium]|nr:diguanylate cyclase [Chitinivibrionales bacterium]